MGASFVLKLDTTPPILTLQAPSSIIYGQTIDIDIQSNEALENWQDIFFLDSIGERHNITLEWLDNKHLTGFVDMSQCSIGKGSIIITLMDIVHNSTTINHELVISSLLSGYELYLKCSYTPVIGRVKYTKITGEIKYNPIKYTIKYVSDKCKIIYTSVIMKIVSMYRRS